jgi:ATP/maltotriose-dependent transcriptional regulator MalT
MATASADRLEAGGAALGRGDWAGARADFEAALAEGDSPEALEGLGRACFLLDDLDASMEAWERGYRGYRERGDTRGAARVACALARQAGQRGEQAVYNGWIERMRRLLLDLEECPEHALLAVQEGLAAFLRNSDPAAACAHAASGRELARRFGLVDLEMLALAIEGASLVASGELARGMGQLDEATAAALGGEMRQLDLIGLTCCFMIYACERVRDFDRAGQWCARMKEYCDRNGLRSVTAVCRTHYATVLTERGEWGDAEAELLTASELLAQRPVLQAEAIARLGELRRLQGRVDEAGALFDRVAFHPRAQLGQAALALDRDDPEGAIGWAERFLRQVPESDRTQRAHGFELLARSRAALGDVAGARAAVAELAAVANEVHSEPLRGALASASGVVEAQSGQRESARSLLEDAVDHYERCGMPCEAAHARLALAAVLRSLGQGQAAGREERQAAQTLERLGIARAALTRVSRRSGELSARELEVLGLVAEGMSDRQIAERLVLSPHTIHRHVSNILAKLGESSRTAAVARAARQGLL